MKARVHVLTAKGHGPNSLFPHELAWLELWSENNANSKVQTSQRPASTSKPMWDENIELEIGEKVTKLMFQMRGKLPAHNGIDEIGFGAYQIPETDISSPVPKVVKVPIFTSNGKEAGEIELEIQIEP